MANYNLVVNSTFKPFTYEDYIKPYEAYGKAYREVEDALSELDTKASVWEGMANKETDPEAYATYSKYAEDLRNQADILATKGLNGASRKSMLDMKKRYNSDIVPIENAYNTRKALIEKQRDLADKDNTVMFDFDAANLSLDDLIKDPTKMYRSYSGSILASQVATAAKAVSEKLRSNPGEWKDILGKQYYEMIEQRGFRPEEIMEVINSREGGSEVLRGMVEDAIGSSGIKGWNNADVLERAYGYAEQGLWSAVGKEERKQVSNKSYDYAMQNWLAKEKEKREAERLKQQQQNQVAINPLNIYSAKEQGAAAANMKNYAKYFTKDKDGNTVLTKEGIEEYNREIRLNTGTMFLSPTIGAGNLNYGAKGAASPFKAFVDSLGTGVLDLSNPLTVGSLWDKYLKDNSSAKYDATKATEFDYTIKPEDQDVWGQKILTASGNTEIRAVDYDPKTKTFKPTGDTISKEDLASGDAKVISTRNSVYGNTVMIMDKKGNVGRYEMPRGINTTNEENRDKAFQKAYQYNKIINEGTYVDADGKKQIATADNIAAAQQAYTDAIQQGYLYHSQLGLQNNTEVQKFSPYGY